MKDGLCLVMLCGLFIFLVVLNKNVFAINDVDSANDIAMVGDTMEESQELERFILLDRQDDFYVVYDDLTKVQYAVSSGTYNRGNLVLLVDSEGKPLLYEE